MLATLFLAEGYKHCSPCFAVLCLPSLLLQHFEMDSPLDSPDGSEHGTLVASPAHSRAPTLLSEVLISIVVSLLALLTCVSCSVAIQGFRLWIWPSISYLCRGKLCEFLKTTNELKFVEKEKTMG